LRGAERSALHRIKRGTSSALKARLVKQDPTAGVENPVRPKNEGFKPWNEEDVAAYEQHWPLGTRQRVWLDVLLYTGLRRGDAARLGRQHIRHGTATLTTEKTGTEVSLPILPVLQRTLDASPCGDLAFIVGAKGQPLTKESFGNEFSRNAQASYAIKWKWLRYLDGAPFDGAAGDIVSEVIFCWELLAVVLSCRLYGLRQPLHVKGR
jgi:integrase